MAIVAVSVEHFWGLSIHSSGFGSILIQETAESGDSP